MNTISEMMASPEWQEFQKAQKEASAKYAEDCDAFWDNLSYEDKLMAFYSVTKRIHKAELEDKGTYRWALYDVFGFGPDSYEIGMECGYMNLHNRIMTDEQYDAYMSSLRNKDGSIQI